jgi:hypothetical protein
MQPLVCEPAAAVFFGFGAPSRQKELVMARDSIFARPAGPASLTLWHGRQRKPAAFFVG